jgi:hypothetical protein
MHGLGRFGGRLAGFLRHRELGPAEECGDEDETFHAAGFQRNGGALPRG